MSSRTDAVPLKPSPPGRILAVDYGRRRLGLALSDEGRSFARPIETLVRANRQQDLACLRKLVSEHHVIQLVVGLPLRLDGTPGEMAEEARTFAERMAKALRLPVALVDERLTSWEAQESLTIPETKQSFSGARRRHTAASKAQRGPDGVDSQAAALILEEFLRSEAAAP